MSAPTPAVVAPQTTVQPSTQPSTTGVASSAVTEIVATTVGPELSAMTTTTAAAIGSTTAGASSTSLNNTAMGQEAPSTIDVPLVAGASAGAAAAVGLPLIVICAVCVVRRGREKKEGGGKEREGKEDEKDIGLSAISAPAPPIVESTNYGAISAAAASDHYSPMGGADEYDRGKLDTVQL